MKFFYIVAVFCALFPAWGTPLEIRPERGVITLEKISSAMIYYRDSKMRESAQSHQVFSPNPRDEKKYFKGTWKLPNGTIVKYDFTEKLSADGKSADLEYRLTAPVDTEYETLSLRFGLNGNEFAGRYIGLQNFAFLLPEKFNPAIYLGHLSDCKKITIPLRSGMLEVIPERPVKGKIFDFRKASRDFKLDLDLSPSSSKTFRQISFKIRLNIVPWQVFPLKLGVGANSVFSDQANGDRKGGWCDQGSSLDLRVIPAGVLNADFASFDIFRSENARECIVLGGGGRKYLPRRTMIPVPNVKMRTLLLLHGSAWPADGETGKITLEFTEGGSQVISVVNNRDVGNWWNPTNFANFRVGFQAPSADGQNVLGLGYSCFPVADKAIRKIYLESSGKSVWMIGAISYSPQILSIPRQQSYVFKRNAEWRPVSSKRDIIKGSALDFSFIQDAPAGKYGFIKVDKNGHFQFEKMKKPVRFYGINLCATSVFLPDAEQCRLADILARIGYNAVRLHHIDMILMKKTPADSLVFDQEKVRSLDHMIFELKKRGLYINIDLFSARKMAPGEFCDLPKLSHSYDYKLGVMLHSAVNANLKAYAKELLTHKNPYTGLSLAEDPVLTNICVLNENTIYDLYENCALFNGESYRYCNKIFDEWCKQKDLKPTPQERPAIMRRFLYERYTAYWTDMEKFLKEELKVKALLSEQNHHQSQLLYSMRSRYDYVDNHYYWDHPAYIGKNMWLPPWQIRNTSSLSAEILPFRIMAPTRILGKPFTVTEFSWCYPNEYRSEGAALMGAYASLQDWDALYAFDFSCYWQAVFLKDYPGPFAVGNDLARLLMERVAAAFFTRRDVKSAAITVPVAVKPNDFDADYVEGYPNTTRKIPFIFKTGSVGFENGKFDRKLPADTLGVLPVTDELKTADIPLFKSARPHGEALKKSGLKDTDQTISSTGELTADFKNCTFKAVTPKSEAFVVPQGRTLNGNFMTVSAQKNYCTVAAVSVDGLPLNESGRILLLHITDVRQENTVFLSAENRVVTKEPSKDDAMLGKHGVARFTLNVLGDFKLYALERDGSVLGEIPFRKIAGGVEFSADTFRIPGKVVFAYELKRL